MGPDQIGLCIITMVTYPVTVLILIETTTREDSHEPQYLHENKCICSFHFRSGLTGHLGHPAHAPVALASHRELVTAWTARTGDILNIVNNFLTRRADTVKIFIHKWFCKRIVLQLISHFFNLDLKTQGIVHFCMLCMVLILYAKNTEMKYERDIHTNGGLASTHRLNLIW